LSEEEKEMGHL